MGDWNGRVGEDRYRAAGCMGGFGTEDTLNQNGRRILDFCITNDLMIGNTFYNHGEDPQYTYESQDNRNKSIIDYIVHTKMLEERVQDIWVEKEAEVSTDHRLVLMEMKEAITRIKTTKKYKKINIEKLKDANTRREYHEEVEKQLGERIEESKHYELETIWKNFREIVVATAKNVCGQRKIDGGRKSSRWWNNEVKAKIKEKKKAWKKYVKTGKIGDKSIYKQKRYEAKLAAGKAKSESWEEFGKEIEREYCANRSKF